MDSKQDFGPKIDTIFLKVLQIFIPVYFNPKFIALYERTRKII